MTLSKGISNFDFIKVIRNFSKKEMGEFNKILRSPFFNNNSKILDLFNELRKHHPDLENKILTKEYLFGIVNNGKKYNDQLFRKYLSRLYKLSEVYFNLTEISNVPINVELNVLQQLSKRNLHDVYDRKLKEINKKFEKNSKVSVSNFYYLHKLNEIKGFHFSKNYPVYDNMNVLMDSVTQLFTYFLSVASINSIQLDTNSVSFRSSYENEFAYSVLKNIKIDHYLLELQKNQKLLNKKDVILVQMISNDLKLNSKYEGEKAYRKLREQVFSNMNNIDENYLLYFLKRMNIFCITEHYKDNTKYHKDLFENYKLIIENELFQYDGVSSLNLPDFRAILFSATRNNEFEWLSNFILKHKDRFGKTMGKDVYNYGMAYLSFFKKEFELSLDHLSKLSSRQFMFAIDTYILKTKIYFEKGFRESAISVSDAFRHYLNKNELISEEFKTGLINYLKYYKNLLVLKDNFNIERTLKVYTGIKKNTRLRNKDWLLEKAEELIKKSSEEIEI